MLASEMIKDLQKKIRTYGDCEMTAGFYDEEQGHDDVSAVDEIEVTNLSYTRQFHIPIPYNPKPKTDD